MPIAVGVLALGAVLSLLIPGKDEAASDAAKSSGEPKPDRRPITGPEPQVLAVSK